MFSRGERAALRAIVEWAVPPDGASPEDVVRYLDDLFAGVSREPRMFVRAALFAMRLGARLRYGRPLEALGPEAKDAYLRGWLENRVYSLRSLAKVVLLNVHMAYYSRPAVLERFGFRPEVLVALRDELRIVDPAAVPPP
jgi:hypothetical protein